MKEGAQERRESEPNYDAVVDALAEFDRQCRADANAADHFDSKIFKDNGFKNVAAFFKKDSYKSDYDSLASRESQNRINIFAAPENPVTWSDADYYATETQLAQLMRLLFEKKHMHIKYDLGEKPSEIKHEEGFRDRKFRDEDEDDPFAKL